MLTEVEAAVQAAGIWVAELRGDDITDAQRAEFRSTLILKIQAELWRWEDGQEYAISLCSLNHVNPVVDALKAAGLFYHHIPLNLIVWISPDGVRVSRYPQEEAA